MKEKKLLDALGNVDEVYIAQICDTQKSKKKPTVKIILIAAALVAMMAVFMGSAWERIYMATSDLDNYPLKNPEQISQEDIKLTASNVTATSMRVFCTIDSVEDGKDAILIQSQGPFTIEKKTAEGWKALPPRFTDTQWDGDQVLTGKTYDWPVDWSGSYGILEPGTYRYLTVVLNGKTPSYAEFTVSDSRNQPLMELLQRTLDSQSYCVRHTITVETGSLDHLNATDRAGIEAITEDSVTEYWKHEDQQLRLTYVEGHLHGGILYKNGISYSLDHEGDNRSNPVIGWSRWTELDRNRLTEWVNLILTAGEYELRDAPDGSGTELVQITRREHEDYGVTSIWTSVWEFDTTNPGAADHKLAQQDVNAARPFSWKLDKQSCDPLAVTFVNTQSQPITTAPEALDRALAEYTGTFTKAIVYRDEADGMWKVEFQKDYGYAGYRYVYLNDSGITQIIAEGAPKDYFR